MCRNVPMSEAPRGEEGSRVRLSCAKPMMDDVYSGGGDQAGQLLCPLGAPGMQAPAHALFMSAANSFISTSCVLQLVSSSSHGHDLSARGAPACCMWTPGKA